jgi:hypothetical protein
MLFDLLFNGFFFEKNQISIESDILVELKTLIFNFFNHCVVVVACWVDLHLILVKVIVRLVYINILEQSDREHLFFILEHLFGINK